MTWALRWPRETRHRPWAPYPTLDVDPYVDGDEPEPRTLWVALGARASTVQIGEAFDVGAVPDAKHFNQGGMSRVAAAERRARIHVALTGRSMSTKDIAIEFGIRYGIACTDVRSLYETGQVVSVGYNVWTAA